MAFEDIQFPGYRKYKNNTSYFKILSRNSFEENQIIGAKTKLNFIIATQLPEMNHIYDLVYNPSQFCLEITENEYVEAFKKL